MAVSSFAILCIRDLLCFIYRIDLHKLDNLWPESGIFTISRVRLNDKLQYMVLFAGQNGKSRQFILKEGQSFVKMA